MAKLLKDLGFVREPDEPKTRNWKRVCKVCGQEFYSVRKDTMYCSTFCRNWHAKNKTTDDTTTTPKTANKPQKARKMPKRVVIMEWSGWGIDWINNAMEFREWARREFGIPKAATTSFAKSKKLIDGCKRNNETFYLTRELHRTKPSIFTLYKIVQG